MQHYKISSESYLDRIYIITAIIKKNYDIQKLVQDVLNLFIEETRFNRQLAESNDIQVIESNNLIKNRSYLSFKYISIVPMPITIATQIFFEIIHSPTKKIIYKSKFNSLDPLTLILETEKKISVLNNVNSDDSLDSIKKEAYDFFKKWTKTSNNESKTSNNESKTSNNESKTSNNESKTSNNESNKDHVLMHKDLQIFLKKTQEHPYLNPEFSNKYIKPVKDFVFYKRENLLKELLANETKMIFNAIYRYDAEALTSELVRGSSDFDINKQHTSFKITLLMFALSRCCFSFNEKSQNNMLHIVYMLLTFGADKTMLDIFKRSALDYLIYGPIIFNGKAELPLTKGLQGSIKHLFKDIEELVEIPLEPLERPLDSSLDTLKDTLVSLERPIIVQQQKININTSNRWKTIKNNNN